jgi:hypothetical protein
MEGEINAKMTGEVLLRNNMGLERGRRFQWNKSNRAFRNKILSLLSGSHLEKKRKHSQMPEFTSFLLLLLLLLHLLLLQAFTPETSPSLVLIASNPSVTEEREKRERE